MARKNPPRVYVYDVTVDNDATDNGTKVTKKCKYYNLEVISVKKELQILETNNAWEMCNYWDHINSEAEDGYLSKIECKEPYDYVEIIIFAPAHSAQGIPEAENSVYPCPLNVIQKCYQNTLPDMMMSKIGFFAIDDRFVGYVFGEQEALALEKAVVKNEKLKREGLSNISERFWDPVNESYF